MDQPQVDPKRKGVGTTESNCPDEHDYKEVSTGAFAARMGQSKTKTLQAGLPDFCFLFANLSSMGLSVPILEIRA